MNERYILVVNIWLKNNDVSAFEVFECQAAVDYGVDLRNHDESRTWNDGYADN